MREPPSRCASLLLCLLCRWMRVHNSAHSACTVASSGSQTSSLHVLSAVTVHICLGSIITLRRGCFKRLGFANGTVKRTHCDTWRLSQRMLLQVPAVYRAGQNHQPHECGCQQHHQLPAPSHGGHCGRSHHHCGGRDTALPADRVSSCFRPCLRWLSAGVGACERRCSQCAVSLRWRRSDLPCVIHVSFPSLSKMPVLELVLP